MKSEFVINTVQGSNSLVRRSVANTADDLQTNATSEISRNAVGQNLDFQLSDTAKSIQKNTEKCI